jgi:hypothetical protein
MTEISNMIRWNANFVRGLAQSVLERARVIRGTLGPVSAAGKAGRKVKAKMASSAKSRRALGRRGRKSGG